MSDEPRTPRLGEVLAVAIEEGKADVHTSMPGKIVKYNKIKQTADIQPMLKSDIRYVDGIQTETLPVLPDVPILFPRSTDFFITFPLKKGDFVLLLFCERSIEKYMDSTGQVTDPTYRHMHDYSDAVALPCMYPFAKSIKDINGDDMVLGRDNKGIQIALTKDGKINITNTGMPTLTIEGQSALAKLTVGSGDMHVAIAEMLEAFYTQIMNVLTIFANTHTHIGNLGAPTATALPPLVMPPWNSAIKSTKVSIPIG
jgi:hypothetical protein